jgi:hypothetical protein
MSAEKPSHPRDSKFNILKRENQKRDPSAATALYQRRDQSGDHSVNCISNKPDEDENEDNDQLNH